MADDPNIAPKSAVLQSITAEAHGFYGVVVTVASTFLGGSLFFLEKFAPPRTSLSMAVLAVGWISLVAAIGLVVRVRFQNLISGKLALQEQYDEASRIDTQNEFLSHVSQWLLIVGIGALAWMGLLNFNQATRANVSSPSRSAKPTTAEPIGQTPRRGFPVDATKASVPNK